MRKLTPDIISAIQEFLRTLALGEIFTIIAVIGVVAAGINKELGTFIIEWNVALAILVGDTLVNVKTALASAVDKYIHKSGVETLLDFKSLDTFK